MMSGSQLIGPFTVYRTRVHPFNERALELAQLFADQAAIAIENARTKVQKADQEKLTVADHGAGSHPALLAVMPFQSIDDNDAGLNSIGARLSASIIMELSSSPLFRLIDRASSFSSSLQQLSPTDSAQRLGADLIATGNIRCLPSGGYRIAASLHQYDQEEPIWSERFDSNGDDTTLLLENLISRLCVSIGIGVERQILSLERARHSTSSGAMGDFLRGFEYHHRHYNDDFLSARKHFEMALESDPEFGRAAAALAIIYVREWFWKSMRPDLLEIAEQKARIAMGIAPHDAWAQAFWGVVALYKHRHHAAELCFKRAEELAPCYVKNGDESRARQTATDFFEKFDIHDYQVNTRPFQHDSDRQRLEDALRLANILPTRYL